MDECDIFREQLAITFPSKGHALWDPHPKTSNRPVEIGDVGFIRMGQFHRLFNILRSADEQSGTRLPEHYERFVPKSPDHIAQGILSRGHYCSAGISVDYRSGIHASSPDDFQEVSFKYCRKRQGAVLFLPVNARREDTLSQSDFGQWMVKHIDDWFSFAQSLGKDIEQMEDIILVTGCHYTRSWGNIAFLGNQANSEATFGFRVNDDPNNNNISIMWQSSILHSPGAVLLQGPQGMNLPEDQCVFVRGFRVARTLKILPKHLKAAAGPYLGPEEDDCEPGVGLVSIPSVAKYRDALHQIIDYVSERTPDCDMVLVHDDDLARVDEIGDGILWEILQHSVVTDLLQNSDKQIHIVSCDLSPVSSSPNTNTDPAVIKVAMLSTEPQNRSSASVTTSANMDAGARSLPKGYAVIDSQSQDRKSDYHETRRTPIVLPLRNASHPAERRSFARLPYHRSVLENLNWASADEDDDGNIDEGHPLAPREPDFTQSATKFPSSFSSTTPPPVRPIPNPPVGKIICDMIPDRFYLASIKPPTRPLLPKPDPIIVAADPGAMVVPPIPSMLLPPPSTPPPSGGLFPRVVVVNPTPHPTPPATPVPADHPTPLPSTGQHLAPPPRLSVTVVRNNSPDATTPSNLVPTPSARPPHILAPVPIAIAAAAPPPPNPRPDRDRDPHPSQHPHPHPQPQPLRPMDETPKLSDLRLFLQQDQLPSPERDGPERGSNGSISTGKSPSETGELQPSSVTSNQTRASAALASSHSIGHGRRSRNLPSRPALTRLNSGRPIVQAMRRDPTKARPPFHANPDKAPKVAGPSSPPRSPLESHSPPPAKAQTRHMNGAAAPKASNMHAATTAAPRRGIVVSYTSSEYETTDTDEDDDDSWASEDVSVDAVDAADTDAGKHPPTKEEIRLRKAALEAQRQRELFMKQPKRSYSNLGRTQLLNPDPNVFPPGHPFFRGMSTHDVTRSGIPSAPTSGKASAALPLAAQVTAEAPVATATSSAHGGYRPKGRPQGEELEDDSDSPDDPDDTIQVSRSLAQRCLAALADEDDDGSWASEIRLREAALEARRRRELFMKQPKRSYSNLGHTQSGLLSQLLNPDPNVFPPRHPFRVTSTHDVTGSGIPSALTSGKASAALPLAAQVTAEAPVATATSSAHGGYRPKGRPQGEELEDDSDSPDDPDDTIQVSRSLAQQRLAALANPSRRRASDNQVPTQASALTRPMLPTVATAPIPLNHPWNLPAPAPLTTPRTTRRQTPATELSESLRRNLLWERQVSKTNLLGNAGRSNALGGGAGGGGSRPLTTAVDGNGVGDVQAGPSQQQRPQHRQERQGHGEGVEESTLSADNARLARNRTWADDFHYAGW